MFVCLLNAMGVCTSQLILHKSLTKILKKGQIWEAQSDLTFVMQRQQEHNFILQFTHLLNAVGLIMNSCPLVLRASGVQMDCREKASWPAACSPPVGVAIGTQQFCPMFCRLPVSTMDTMVAHLVTSPAEAFCASFQLWFWLYVPFVPSKKILTDAAELGFVLVRSQSQWLTSFCHKQMSSTDPENLSRPGPTHPNWGTQPGETSPLSTLPPTWPRQMPHCVASGSDRVTSRSVDRLQRSPASHF